MCDPVIGGVATFASGALGAIGSHQSAQAQADAQNEAAIRNYNYQVKLREADWNRQLAIHNNKIADYKNTTSANASAADRAYASEQYRLNEMFQQAAFQKQDMLSQLIQSQGGIAASGMSGKTVSRLNQAALSGYGRNNAIIAENLASARNAMINRNEDTRLQLQGANNQAWSQVAIGPTPGIAPMQPTMAAGPSSSSLLLGLGSAALGGFTSYMNAKAPKSLGDNYYGGSAGYQTIPGASPLPSTNWGGNGFNSNNNIFGIGGSSSAFKWRT